MNLNLETPCRENLFNVPKEKSPLFRSVQKLQELKELKMHTEDYSVEDRSLPFYGTGQINVQVSGGGVESYFYYKNLGEAIMDVTANLVEEIGDSIRSIAKFIVSLQQQATLRDYFERGYGYRDLQEELIPTKEVGLIQLKFLENFAKFPDRLEDAKRDVEYTEEIQKFFRTLSEAWHNQHELSKTEAGYGKAYIFHGVYLDYPKYHTSDKKYPQYSIYSAPQLQDVGQHEASYLDRKPFGNPAQFLDPERLNASEISFDEFRFIKNLEDSEFDDFKNHAIQDFHLAVDALEKDYPEIHRKLIGVN